MQPTHEKLHQIFIYMTDFERGGGCERLQAGLLQNGIPPMVAMGQAAMQSEAQKELEEQMQDMMMSSQTKPNRTIEPEENEYRYSKDGFDQEDNDAVVVNEVFDLTKVDIEDIKKFSKSTKLKPMRKKKRKQAAELA